MGSGCNNSRISTCVTTTPDTCVQYTGPAIPSLGICNKDMLNEVEAVILNKIVDYATGVGITIEDLDFTQCDFLEGFISCCAQDDSLKGILEVILKMFCSVDTEITNVKTDITTIKNNISYTINAGCLTVANTKIDTVLNKLISDYCDFKTAVTNIFGDINNPVINNVVINQITDSVLNTVFANIRGCLPTDVSKTGTGINTIITINGITPIGGMIFGEWDASNFDNTGLGLANRGFCGWALCNGLNNTKDWRGFAPAMATNLPSANDLNTIVDPVFNGDASYGTNVGDIKGSVKHLLVDNEVPLKVHTHAITEVPHSHTFPVKNASGVSSGINVGASDGTGGVIFNQTTSTSNTGVTISPSAPQVATVAHDNRQPTKYVTFIQRIS